MQRGIAKLAREWMQTQGAPWRLDVMVHALGVDRERLRHALKDFVNRGEVERLSSGRYRYMTGYRKPLRGDTLPAIYRAMYFMTTWTSRDIHRMVDAPDTGWVNRVIRRLVKSGHVEICGSRKLEAAIGRERIYRISDRERFRTEIMK